MNARIVGIFVLGVVGLALAADPAKEEAAKKDLAQMKGTWVLAFYVVDGKTMYPDELAPYRLTVNGNQYTFAKGKEVTHGTYDLDPSTKPKKVDITMTDGPDKGKKRLCLYGFQFDQLRFCIAAVGAERPKTLTMGPGVSYEVWLRDKTSKPPEKKVVADKKAPAAAPKPPPPPPPVTIPDKKLEAAIRAALHEPTAPLTESSLLNVHILEGTDKGISSLKGLDKCKNLALLKLTKNAVSDLAPLRELVNLQSLDLADNRITDIGPLAGLTKLQYLELSGNQVTRLDALAGLTALNSLYLVNNKIADLAPVAKLTKLWSLSVNRNHVKDISALAGLKRLDTLDLADNLVSDLAPLGKLADIKLLILDRNKISDLTPLINLVKTDAQGEKRIGPFLRLYLAGNPLADATKASQLQALKSFGVRIESS